MPKKIRSGTGTEKIITIIINENCLARRNVFVCFRFYAKIVSCRVKYRTCRKTTADGSDRAIKEDRLRTIDFSHGQCVYTVFRNSSQYYLFLRMFARHSVHISNAPREYAFFFATETRVFYRPDRTHHAMLQCDFWFFFFSVEPRRSLKPFCDFVLKKERTKKCPPFAVRRRTIFFFFCADNNRRAERAYGGGACGVGGGEKNKKKKLIKNKNFIVFTTAKAYKAGR